MSLRLKRCGLVLALIASSLVLRAETSSFEMPEIVLETVAKKDTWALSQDAIKEHTQSYVQRKSRDSILRTLSKTALYAGGIYSVYYIGTGFYGWLFGKSSALPVVLLAAAGQTIEIRVLALEKCVTKLYAKLPENGTLASSLKQFGTILAASYAMGAFSQVYGFAHNTLYRTYLARLYSSSEELFASLEYSSEQITVFQGVDDEIFNNHSAALSTYTEKSLIPWCEEFIGLLAAFVEDFPQLSQLNNLTHKPSYFVTLTNKIVADLQNRYEILTLDSSNATAVGDIKQKLELLRNEIVAAMTHIKLVAERA